MWNADIEKVLISESELDAIVSRLAEKINNDYKNSDKRVVLLCILKGSIIFMSDLMKKLHIPVEIECMKVSSYGSGTVSTGNVKITLDVLRDDISDCDFLIVEDIIDSGNTLSYLVKYLELKGASSVKTCTLLDKPSRRVVDFKADISLFTIPDHFVIGYGLDCGEYYRNLPYIAEYGE